jgi:hypothetical protein
MPSPVDIFEDWIRAGKLGARFHPIPDELSDVFAYQLGDFARRLRRLNEHFKLNPPIDIYADFIDIVGCDAVAGFEEGIGLIAIGKGMVLLPLEMFFAAFSHPFVFTQLGNSASEHVGPQHSMGIPKDCDDLMQARVRARQPLLPPLPACPIRREIAKLCMDLAWRFIVMHEVTHIAYGHVKYLQHARHVRFIRESLQAFGSQQVSKKALDYQTIELSADCAAAQTVMAGFLKDSPKVAELGFPTPRERLVLWSFVLYTVFRIWGLTVDPTKLGKFKHPPTTTRFEMLTVGACYDVAQTIPEIRDDYYPLVFAGQREAENAIAFCGGDRLVPADLIGTFDPRVRAHLDELAAHHDDVLRVEMGKYARIPITLR